MITYFLMLPSHCQDIQFILNDHILSKSSGRQDGQVGFCNDNKSHTVCEQKQRSMCLHDQLKHEVHTYCIHAV